MLPVLGPVNLLTLNLEYISPFFLLLTPPHSLGIKIIIKSLEYDCCLIISTLNLVSYL